MHIAIFYKLQDYWQPLEESILGSYKYAITKTQPVAAVIIDWDFNLTVKQLLRAQLLLEDPNCLFIKGATDLMLPLPRPMFGRL